MSGISPYDWAREKLLEGWRNRALSLKAISFGLIGVVNTVVDFSVFLAARSAFDHSPQAVRAIGGLADWCRCGSVAALTLVAANLVAWLVAVSGSYVMNSSITFAAESGRKLRWRDYAAFVGSGVIGWLANTATLILAARYLLLPIAVAKAAAILASFVVNFSLSHFVVFRVREP